MAVYNVNGVQLDAVYNVNGVSLDAVYNVNGVNIFESAPDIPVEPLEWDMSLAYKDQITSALSDIDAYQKTHRGSFSFAQFNDVHEVYGANEPNYIDYNKGYKTLSRIVFLGDMVNNFTSTTSPQAVAYMVGASASKRIIGMGNHEYFIASGGGNPATAYKPSINASATFMETSSPALIYYSDDEKNNVRYIVLDFYWVRQSGADEDHLLDDDQLMWCASAMQSAGSKNIVVFGHMPIPTFSLIPSGETRTSTGLINRQNLIDLIHAFQARGTFEFESDGVTHEYDFADCTGRFILYSSGHYHRLGAGDDNGYLAFTTPTLLTSGHAVGFTFFLIDTTLRTVRMYVCSKTQGQYVAYDYSF